MSTRARRENAHRDIRGSSASWSAIGRNPLGRSNAWSSPATPRLTVRHCGHPTAIRPYYIEADGERFACERKFSRLQEAQRAAELLAAAGLLDAVAAADDLLDARFDDWFARRTV